MKEGLHQRGTEVNIADGVDHGVVELVDVVGDEVSQGRVFGVAPESLDRIEIGRVSGQPFDVEPGRSALLQLANRRPMDVEPIQHHDQRPEYRQMGDRSSASGRNPPRGSVGVLSGIERHGRLRRHDDRLAAAEVDRFLRRLDAQGTGSRTTRLCPARPTRKIPQEHPRSETAQAPKNQRQRRSPRLDRRDPETKQMAASQGWLIHPTTVLSHNLVQSLRREE